MAAPLKKQRRAAQQAPAHSGGFDRWFDGRDFFLNRVVFEEPVDGRLTLATLVGPDCGASLEGVFLTSLMQVCRLRERVQESEGRSSSPPPLSLSLSPSLSLFLPALPTSTGQRRVDGS